MIKGGSVVLVDCCFFFSGELCQQWRRRKIMVLLPLLLAGKRMNNSSWLELERTKRKGIKGCLARAKVILEKFKFLLTFPKIHFYLYKKVAFIILPNIFCFFMFFLKAKRCFKK